MLLCLLNIAWKTTAGKSKAFHFFQQYDDNYDDFMFVRKGTAATLSDCSVLQPTLAREARGWCGGTAQEEGVPRDVRARPLGLRCDSSHSYSVTSSQYARSNMLQWSTAGTQLTSKRELPS